jgi:hypothetical protein
LGNINDSCVLRLTEDGLHGIVSNGDNSLYAHAFIKGQFEELTLNLPSLKKLSKALDLIDKDDVPLTINRNNLEYKDKKIKFKYHLHENGIISSPLLSVEKIKSFDYDIRFDLDFEFLSDVLQKSSITNTKKVYLYTEDSSLIWKIGDDSVPNSDFLCITGEEVDFELNNFIIKIDNLKLLTKISKAGNLFKINSSIGLGSIVSTVGDFYLEYLFPSLKNKN